MKERSAGASVCHAISAEDLAAYLNGAADETLRAAIAAHLETCDVCRAVVERTGKSLTVASPPAEPASTKRTTDTRIDPDRRSGR